MDEVPIYRIVLTGGPCGGKTTAQAQLTERLSALGFRVYLVPEPATLLLTGGASLADVSVDQLMRFEASLLGLQMSLEDSFLEIARSRGVPAILICDRGTMDAAAYLPHDTWQALLDEQQWSVVNLRDRRYDAIIHLVTAADGAAAYYTTANNRARTESAQQACDLDRRLRKAWVGHPHLRIIDNSTPFAEKVRRVIAAVCDVVGLPQPGAVQRRFLVHTPPVDMPVEYEEFSVEQTWLKTSDGSEARVRRRGQLGAFTYSHSVNQSQAAGGAVRLDRPISAREYLNLLALADSNRHPVRKRQRCFLYGNQYYELDLFEVPHDGLLILEAEVENGEQAMDLPPFLTVAREITTDPDFAHLRLATVSQ